MRTDVGRGTVPVKDLTEMTEINKNFPMALHLSENLSWSIAGTPETRLWVEQLAWIMGLRQVSFNGSPSLIFCRSVLDERKKDQCIQTLSKIVSRELPLGGWRSSKGNIMEVWSHEESSNAIFDLGEKSMNEIVILQMSSVAQFLFRKAAFLGGIPFHSALLDCMGRGVLLAAQGGGGKSTCSRRIPAPWRALCDDETVVIKNSESNFRVHPFPTWSEYIWRRSTPTWDVQRNLPLAAVFFLEQAEKDEVISLGKATATACINRSAREPLDLIRVDCDPEEKRKIRKRVFENAAELAKAVPTYRLKVSLTGRFWEKIEEVLEREPSAKDEKKEGVRYEGRSSAEALRS